MPEKDIFNFIKYQESGVIRPVLESAFASADKDAVKGGKRVNKLKVIVVASETESRITAKNLLENENFAFLHM